MHKTSLYGSKLIRMTYQARGARDCTNEVIYYYINIAHLNTSLALVCGIHAQLLCTIVTIVHSHRACN